MSSKQRTLHTMEELMTINELRVFLQTINRLTWVGLEITTTKRMNDYLDYWLFDQNGKKKKNPNPTPNPFLPSGIQSEQKLYRIICGFNYKKTVERRRKRKNLVPEFQKETDKEPTFIHISNCLVQNKKDESKFYFMYLRCNRSTIEQRYLFEKNPIEKQLFQDYLTTSNNRYGNQGLGDDCVPVEMVSLSNIRRIKINGRNIRVVNQDTTLNLQTQTEGVMV